MLRSAKLVPVGNFEQDLHDVHDNLTILGGFQDVLHNRCQYELLDCMTNAMYRMHLHLYETQGIIALSHHDPCS